MNSHQKHILQQIDALNVWRRHSERAPHKPLLILLALARIQQKQDRLTLFHDLNPLLTRLLKDFGAPRKRVQPEFPFWWLQSDGLWEVDDSVFLERRKGHNDPKKSELISKKVKGGFPETIFQTFLNDSSFLGLVATKVLNAHFPESLHEDILNEVGLVLTEQGPRLRNAQFRRNVIRAYEHACAVCGYDLKIDMSDLALEAAHIKWHAAGGPDEIPNGLALCAIHHKAFDRGAFGIGKNHEILISTDIYGHTGFSEWFTSFHGKQLRLPIRAEWRPKPEFIHWHAVNVFRSPARS